MKTIQLTDTEAELLMGALESCYKQPTTEANTSEKAMIENVIRQLLGQLS